jgi:hypothetical protein
MPGSKKTSKTKSPSKTSKSKASKSKASSKPKKVPKLKVFCGITDVPKGKRLGSMKECLDAKQVRYYGVTKIDSKLIETANNGLNTKSDLIVKKAGLVAKFSKLKKEVLEAKNNEEKKKKLQEYEEVRKLLITITEKLSKFN